MGKKFGDSSLSRKGKFRESNKIYLLVCEGENTEPDYFNFLKKKLQKRESNFNIVVKGNLGQHKKVVENASKIAKKENIQSKDEVWCIFDREKETTKAGESELPLKKILDAIQHAKDKNFKIGLSNQTFEYWILLHLEKLKGDYLDKDDYIPKINSIINKGGFKLDEKSKNIDENFFDKILFPNLKNALDRSNSIQQNCPSKEICFQERNCSNINHLIIKLLKDLGNFESKEYLEIFEKSKLKDCINSD